MILYQFFIAIHARKQVEAKAEARMKFLSRVLFKRNKRRKEEIHVKKNKTYFQQLCFRKRPVKDECVGANEALDVLRVYFMILLTFKSFYEKKIALVNLLLNKFSVLLLNFSVDE